MYTVTYVTQEGHHRKAGPYYTYDDAKEALARAGRQGYRTVTILKRDRT